MNATLVSVNSQFGMDTITRDSESGLEWLDVPISTNISFDDIGTQFGVGGAFEGFRHATSTEILELFTHAGIVNFSPSVVFSGTGFTGAAGCYQNKFL